MTVFARIGRREWLTGLGAGGGLLWTRSSWAGAARPMSLDALVNLSDYAVVGSSESSTAAWEGSGSSGQRIVSYHRLTVHESLTSASPPDGTLYVRTLGGRVGGIAQRVHGEASLTPHEASVLFLRATVSGAFGVVAMAQGHYPLLTDEEGTPRLTTSPYLGDFIKKDPQSAVGQLRGKTLATCEQLIAEVLTR